MNRVIGDKLAIVEDKPGITRDSIYSVEEWTGNSFSIIDMGGIEIRTDAIKQSTRA
mgnify:CR=1 FL=1